MDCPRFIAALRRIAYTTASDLEEALCELDSHADTCVGGSNTARLGPVLYTVMVSAFAPSCGSQEFPVATVGTVWANPEDSKECLLVIHQAIHAGKSMNHALLCPNQLRCNGVRVDDCPPQFDERSEHATIVSDPPVKIPLHLSGVVSSFHTRLPTKKDVADLPRITLTGTAPWNPRELPSPEDIPVPIQATTVEETSTEESFTDERLIAAHNVTRLCPLDVHHADDDAFHTALVKAVNVTVDPEVEQQVSALQIDPVSVLDAEEVLFQPAIEQPEVAAVTLDKRKPRVNPEQLAAQWNIGLDTAKQTLKVTTQAGLRNVYLPSERKVRLKAPWLKFPSINTRIYSDALFAKVPSIHKARAAIVYTDGHGFDSVYPVISKRE